MSQQNSQNKYAVDIVLCIDSTGSMEPVIEDVKKNALNLHKDLLKKLEEKDRYVDSIRVRVISFRDYYCDGDDAMLESDFFTLPEQNEDFKRFVSGIEAKGGGDEPENGLEAIALAMRSDWCKSTPKRREVIVVWTDATAHPLDVDDADKEKGSNYPTGLPQNFDAITDEWTNRQGFMEKSAKRLVVFAPEGYPWNDIHTYWDNVVYTQSKAGKGLEEMDMQSILELVANSIAM